MEIINVSNNRAQNIDALLKIRLEMLREVNGLSDAYEYDKDFIANCRDNFLNGDQTDLLCVEDGQAVGCATLCYIYMMPTFDHPTGKRAHLMNVYVRKDFRRCGFAKKMMEMLIAEAKARGVTEISLDATEKGKPLYEALGFEYNASGMALGL